MRSITPGPGNTTPQWLRSFFLGAVRFYQVALRPLNPWGCKFYPSCSHYALEAVERFGLARGSWLSVQRLLRCRPGVLGGYDPVPDSYPGTEATGEAAKVAG